MTKPINWFEIFVKPTSNRASRFYRGYARRRFKFRRSPG